MAISLIDKIKQKNNGTFKLVDAVDIAWDDHTGLVDKINSIEAGGNVDLSGYLTKADASSTYLAKADYHAYELPAASADTLGGVKVGSGLTITDGVLSANAVDLSGYQTKIGDTLDVANVHLMGADSGIQLGGMPGAQLHGKEGKIYYGEGTDATTSPGNELATVASVSGKVDKVEGKGLSSNDYTTDEKTKLASLKNYTAGSNITISDTGEISASVPEGVVAATEEQILTCYTSANPSA